MTAPVSAPSIASALARQFSFAFTTGSSTVRAVEPQRDVPFCHLPTRLCPLPDDACTEPVPTAAELPSGPNAFFRSSCSRGTAACHGPGKSDLSGGGFLLDEADGGTPQAILQLTGALSRGEPVVARATERGPFIVPHRSPNDPFGFNMPYIDPNNPGNSYLLYKLILALPSPCPFDPTEESPSPDPGACTDDGGTASPSAFARTLYDCNELADAARARDPDTGACSETRPVFRPRPNARMLETSSLPWPSMGPAIQWKPPASGESLRLRRVVSGQGMPPNGVTRRQDALDISAWIAAGAHARVFMPFHDTLDRAPRVSERRPPYGVLTRSTGLPYRTRSSATLAWSNEEGVVPKTIES